MRKRPIDIAMVVKMLKCVFNSKQFLSNSLNNYVTKIGLLD